jgi:agmatinase
MTKRGLPKPRRRAATKSARPPAPFDPDAAAQPGSGIFGLTSSPADAAVVLVPVPFEATTSYGGGASRGPAAILEASRQVDLLDRDYGAVHEGGIAMLQIPAHVKRLDARARRSARPVIRAGGVRPGNARLERAVRAVDEAGEEVNEWVRAQAARHLDLGQLVGVVGGDHAAPYGLIAELASRHAGLGILHVDAHADIREAYEGFTWSHASIMFQVATTLPAVSRIVQVGIRDFGTRELEMIETSEGRIRTWFEADARRAMFGGATWDDLCRRAVEDLPVEVHVSFDIDGLSPDLCPHTGTPVPGGLSFAEACHLLLVLAESGRRVVGFDLCEVSPGPRGDEWDANVGARVLYKLIGCALRSGKDFEGEGRARQA